MCNHSTLFIWTSWKFAHNTNSGNIEQSEVRDLLVDRCQLLIKADYFFSSKTLNNKTNSPKVFFNQISRNFALFRFILVIPFLRVKQRVEFLLIFNDRQYTVSKFLSRIYTGDFFATRFEDFLCVKISLAEWLLTRGKTRLPRSRLRRIAAV